MVAGRFGECHKEFEDDRAVVYSYRGEDGSLPGEQAEEAGSVEGSFTIRKSALEEPEISIVRGRLSRHRRGFVERRTPHLPDVEAHFASGEVTVEPCGVDILAGKDSECPPWAYALIVRVLVRYMLDGELPQEECFSL